MLKKMFLIVYFGIISQGLYSQLTAMELTFTGVNSIAYVKLDSIKIINRTLDIETVIYWPDTSILLEINPGNLLLLIGYSTFSVTGIHENELDKEPFQLYQNFPNPTKSQSLISLMIPEEGVVRMTVTDLQGRVLANSVRQLSKGYHTFGFTPGDDHLYLVSAIFKGIIQSIKIVNAASEKGKKCMLDYIGSFEDAPEMDQKSMNMGFVKQSGILDAPEESSTYIFQFATNIPCLGTPVITYEGKVYNTIQIFSQCWLKDNLNVGSRIQSSTEQTDNGIIEKYCYGNMESFCTTYGGLYQGNEMMQYNNQQGVRGICPPGWHVPTDEDWKVLEGAVDSKYRIGDTEWDRVWGSRGFDVAKNLKTAIGWNDDGNGADLFGFSGLPASCRQDGGSFAIIGYYGLWWTSTEINIDSTWNRHFTYNSPHAYRTMWDKEWGFSVRCLRDN
jgi:uncharacterized protein (TIGR02145 family)